MAKGSPSHSNASGSTSAHTQDASTPSNRPRQARFLLWRLLVAGLLIGATIFVFGRAKHLWRSGEAGATVWFYDQSEQRLYAAPTDTLPPDKGIGGKRNDGVRAVVVGFRSAKEPIKRIAYLETYTPELKQRLEQVRAARAAHQPAPDGPARDSEFFETNTLVKRVDDPDWSQAGSPEGQRITSEWRAWRGPEGQPPVVAVP